MTDKPFDQFNKNLFRTLLSPFGQVFPNFAVPGEERAIDVFFVPHMGAMAGEEELGYLAQISRQPALLEPFRGALLAQHVHSCMLKLFLVFADLQREHPTVEVHGCPHLWILAAEVSDRLLNDFLEPPEMNLMDGVYPLRSGLHTTIIAIEELPVVPETLWLRLMGKGRTQDDAISDLLMLPESDARRSMGLDLLVSWRINMEIMEQVELEERRILMALSQVYVEWEKQTEARGETRGKAQGLEQGRREVIESLLLARFEEIDRELAAVVPRLMAMESKDCTKILLSASRSDLLMLGRG
jgi:hypothetical protein